MERWNGKVAVVTGASSGIGLVTAKALVQHGLTVIGLSRRKTQMENNMKGVMGPGKFYAKECDITKEESVIESLKWVKNTFGSLNILINNAGILNMGSSIEDTPTATIEHIFNVNVLGLLYCTKQAIKLMKENQKEAHIVNLNSILGHTVSSVPGLNVYPASKFAVTALSETLKNELLDSKIRVTSISPGGTQSEMIEKVKESGPAAATYITQIPVLEAEDIANSIVYVLGVPPHVEINEITIQAKKM